MNLKDAIELFDDNSKFEFYVDDEKVEFLDEYGLDTRPEEFFLCGHEYGATNLVHAGSFDDAWEAWVDSLPTILADEVHEAHNAFDRLVDYMVSKGHENDYQLRHFCSSWASFYFYVDARCSDAWDRWPLDESYEMQANAKGTGIVNMGHNSWMREVDISTIRVERKALALS